MNENVASQGGLVVQFDGGGERKGIFDSGGSVNVGRVVG
jgi:hypothetical protein